MPHSCPSALLMPTLTTRDQMRVVAMLETILILLQGPCLILWIPSVSVLRERCFLELSSVRYRATEDGCHKVSLQAHTTEMCLMRTDQWFVIASLLSPYALCSY